MKDSIKTKLETLRERYEEIEALLSDADTISNQTKFRELSKEYSQIEPVVLAFRQYQQAVLDVESAELMLSEPDPEMKAMAEEEIVDAKTRVDELEAALQVLLLPKDEADSRNIYLEIRAGAGGDEASIFAGDLFRMYSRYAERQGWQVDVVSSNAGEHGGFKEVIAEIRGNMVYGKLKFESGAHRVQRVPATEAQGRIHTSTCTIAVMPEVEAIDEIVINADQVRVDTYRASGAGGQHINKTDSAIRLTHLPTGLVVECQDERSQHKNRAKAFALLQSKLLLAEQTKQQEAQAQTRRNLVGSGDRSERIRTYNFPQGRLTDHRINLTLYKLDDIMEGDLEPVIEPLVREHQADLLAELGESG